MPIATRTFRVFVSSTFEDLKAERNALAAPGGPFEELTKVCQRYGARFQAIDLRWGVREEAGHDQRTMEICLGEIERCQQTKIKPNFIILLGDRYGWRPLPARINAAEFEAVRDRIADAVDRQRVDEWYRLDENAVPPEYLLKPRTGEFKDKDGWGKVETPMHRALWEAALAAGLSRDALIKYEASATHQEILQGLGKTAADREHVFAFFCKPSGPNEDPDLGKLKQFLREQLKGNVFEPHDTAELCARVRENLERVIQAEAEGFKSRPALDLEVEAHEAFARNRARNFMGREHALGGINDYINGPDRQPMVVHGASGSGKSALMARASEAALADLGNAVVIRRFIGATPESSSGITLLRSLCAQIGERYGITEEIPLEFHSVVRTFAGWLALATPEQPLVLFIDALDQIAANDPAAAVTWLMPELPPHCRVVVSATEVARSLERARIFPLQALPAKDAEGVLALWLHDAKRKLQDRQRTKVLDYFNRCGLPLYLKLAFEEARRWRSFDEPDVCLLGEELAGIIDVLFARLSSGADHAKVLVGRSLGYLAAARYGLTEDEMLDVLTRDEDVWQEFDAAKRHDPPERRLPVIVWSRLFLDLEPYLTERSAPGGTVVSFYHRQLEEQAAAHFLGGDDRGNCHKSLLTYLTAQPHYLDANNNHPNARKVSELNYQQRCAKRLSEAAATLSDMGFVSAKCAAGLVADLQADYSATIAALPEAQPQLQEEAGFQSEAERWTRELIQYASRATRRWMPPRWIALMTPRWVRQVLATRWHALPRMIESVERWSEDRIAAEIERIRTTPTPLDIVQAFLDFVRSQSHALQLYGATPGFVSQQAYNHAPAGPVHSEAERNIQSVAVLILQRMWPPHASYNPRPLVVRTLQGHTGPILTVSLTGDGRCAVSGSTDKTVRVWDLETGACLRILEGHTHNVRGVSVTPDGELAVSASDDCTLRVWDTYRGECLRTLEADHRLWCVSVAPHGRLAISAGEFSPVVWGLDGGERLLELANAGFAQGVILLPDGRRAVLAIDKELQLWDLRYGLCLRTLEGHSDNILSVSATPDGRLAVSVCEDGGLRAWDLEAGRCIAILNGHVGSASSVSVTPDGRIAVSSGHDKTLRVWELSNGTCLRVLSGHSDVVNSVSVTPDGRRAVSGGHDSTLRVWDLERGRHIRTSDTHKDAVSWLRVAANGRRAISASGDEPLRVWDLESERSMHTLKGHGGWVSALAITPNGRRAVSASEDETVRVWDLDTGACLHTLEGHQCPVDVLSMTPDGRLAVSGGRDGGLHVWDLEAGRPIEMWLGHEFGPFGRIKIVNLAEDGRRAVSASTDGWLRVWDVAGGECQYELDHCIDASVGTSSRRNCVAAMVSGMTPDLRRAVSAWHPDGGVRGGLILHRGYTLHVWDLASGQHLRTLIGHTDKVNSIEVTPDGRRAVSGGDDGRLRVWDVEAGACLQVLEGHSDRIWKIVMAPDGTWAVSVSDDNTVRVWELENGVCFAIAWLSPPCRSIAVLPSLAQIVVGNSAGEVSRLQIRVPTVEGQRPLNPPEDFGLSSIPREILRTAAAKGPVRRLAEETDYPRIYRLP